MNASGSVPGCAMIQHDMYQKMMNGGFATNIMPALYDHAKQYDNECSSHVNSNGGSCMAIYLGIAMEMP